MENLLKKALYTGVGLVTVASDKVQETVKNLVDNGKLSEGEGKKVVEDFMSDLESKKDEFEGRINKIVSKVVNTVDLPSKSDFAILKSRIKDLEKQLDSSGTTKSSKSVKKVVKKAIAKKTTSAKAAVAKKVAPVKKAMVKKVAATKKVLVKKTAPVKKVIAKKVAPAKKVMVKKVTIADKAIV